MAKIIALMKKYREIILYLIIGALTTLVSFLVQWICKDIFLFDNVFWETAVAWFCSVLFAFFTNKLIVFESKQKQGFFQELFMFYGARGFTGALEIGSMFLFVDIARLNYWAVKIITNVVIIVLNYILSKFIIFKKGSTESK